MYKITREFCLTFLVMFVYMNTYCQDQKPSPELAQMYTNIAEKISLGDYPGAIITSRQALRLAPGNIGFATILGRAQYLSGLFKDARETLYSVSTNTITDTEYYRILAACQYKLNETKAACKTLAEGSKVCRSPGCLYFDLGNIYRATAGEEKAIKAFLSGIQADYSFPSNYRAAASWYLSSENVLWGLIYGEMYLAMLHDTTEDYRLKCDLFTGWQLFLDKLPETAGRDRNVTSKKNTDSDFESAVKQTYLQLTPVISDGLSVENMTMLRARFLMDWYSNCGVKYPFRFFDYQQNLLGNGYSDICTEWLYGQTANRDEYDAWNNFHDGAISRFVEWKKSFPFQPAAPEAGYNKMMAGPGTNRQHD